MLGDKVKVITTKFKNNKAIKRSRTGVVIFENSYFKTIKGEHYNFTVHNSDLITGEAEMKVLQQ